MTLVAVVLVSCKNRRMNSDVKEAIEMAVIGVSMLFNLIILGVTSLAFSFGYSKRTRNRETLKVVTIILIVLFTLITARLFSMCSLDFQEYPGIGFQFVAAGIIIGITIYQLIIGSKRKINETDNQHKVPMTDKKDEKIPPDEEIF